MKDPTSSCIEPETTGSENENETGRITRPRVVSFSTDRSSAFCPSCREIVNLRTIIDAAGEFNTDIQDIRFLLSQEDIHSVTHVPGVISLCSISLADCFERRKTRLLDSHFEIKLQNSMGGIKPE
jgi:hypothetical protein